MKNENMKKTEPKAESSSDEEILQTEKDFPTLGGMTRAASMQPNRHSPTEPSEYSLANKIAKAHGKSVQHSQMSQEMFPVLPDSNSPSLKPKSVNKKTVPGKRTDPPEGVYSDIIRHSNIIADGDFPELQSKQKSVGNKVSATQWTKPNHIQNPITKFPKNTKTDTSISHKIVPLSKKSKLEESKPSLTKLGRVLKDDNEFPTLGGKNLNSLAPPVTAQWVQRNNNSPVTNGHDEMVSKCDNFSENKLLTKESNTFKKSNDKKKKNKTKKNEVNSETGRKTLDSIATLLLESNIDERESDSTPVEEVVVSKKEDKQAPVSKHREEEFNASVQKSDEECQNVVNKNQLPTPDLQKTEIVVVEVQKSKQNNTDSNTKKQKHQQMPKFHIDDFPELSATSVTGKSNQPPPGFSSVKPPPGFVTKNGNRPPPGFSMQKDENKFENMSQQLNMPAEYSKPNDFQNRNQKLIKDIANSLSKFEGRFDEFKSFSGEFRRGQISASDYYQRCRSILGEKTFEDIFPELLALLPDIDKQQQLLAIHSSCRDESNDNVLRISSKVRAGWKSPTSLRSCPTCQQVVVSDDFDSHTENHSQNADFPSLNSSWSQNLKCNAWIKAT